VVLDHGVDYSTIRIAGVLLWHECKEEAAGWYSSTTTSKGICSRGSLLCLDAASFAPRLSFGHYSWRIFFVAGVDDDHQPFFSYKQQQQNQDVQQQQQQQQELVVLVNHHV